MKDTLVAFDLDGTLIDSAQDVCNALNKTVTDLGRQPIPDEVIVAHIGEGLRRLLADFVPEANEQSRAALDLEQTFINNYEKEMLNHTKLYEGVEDFLSSFPGSISIITNKNERQTKQIVSHFKLDRFKWVHIIGADTLAERKPSPLGLNTVMQLSGVPKHKTFMVGDGTPDMISAQRAGVNAIAIGFGYTERSILQKYNPVAFLEGYGELSEIMHKFVRSK